VTSSLKLFQVADALVKSSSVRSAVLKTFMNAVNIILEVTVVQDEQFIFTHVENVITNGNFKKIL